MVGDTCTSNADCCTGNCDPGAKICSQVIGTCHAGGGACTGPQDCCTFVCNGGCHCTKNDCGNRSTCCNVFRYGQCNTEVLGTTEVVCRMVTCVSPSTLFVNCNSTYFEDNNTCSHEEGCL